MVEQAATARVLLDSVIVIDHLNGIAEATSYLQRCSDMAWLSAITRADVLCGLQGTAAAQTKRLLDRFHFIAIDATIADLAAEYRRLHGWRLPDALQASAAVLHGLRLATRNIKDFPPERFAFVEVPYRVS